MVTFGSGGGFGGMFGSILSAAALHDRQHARDVVSSGFAGLDALLPAGGVRRGSLIELVSGEPGSGGATLACAVACRLAAPGACRRAAPVPCRRAAPVPCQRAAPGGPDGIGGADAGGTIVIVDRRGWFHPPAVLPWCGAPPVRAAASGPEGAALRRGSTGQRAGYRAGHCAGGPRLIVVRPSHDDDELWAIDQALRCAGVTAVVAWPQATAGAAAPNGARPGGAKRRSVAMRRWQLAARTSGAVGLIVRSGAVRSEPCWSEARIAVAPLPSGRNGGSLLTRRLRLERVGGIWCGGRTGLSQAAASQVREIVFDLARGCEQPAGPASFRSIGSSREVWRVAE